MQAIHGIVSAVDPTSHAIKVLLQPENIETGWIPDGAVTQVGDLCIACPSAPGSHVLLQPVDGDGEHFVVVAVIYDAVMKPVASPVTGRAAQTGEWLMRAGCGSGGGTDAGWVHVTADGFFAGAGGVSLSLREGACVVKVGEVQAVLSAGGLHVTGGDISTSDHALGGHVHPLADMMTGGPVG